MLGERALTSALAIGRNGGVVYNITGECERLFCELLRATFLGERKAVQQDSLVMDTCETTNIDRSFLDEWIEVWDYTGNMRFRGFVGCTLENRSLFIFFEPSAIGNDLKPGLMALIELASNTRLDCSQLVVCLDRLIDPNILRALIRNLGWVGFGLTTMAPWTGGTNEISKKWLILAVET